MMKISACVELVWKLAAQEAIAGEFKEIEPDHFFAGLLKFSEIPVESMGSAQDAPPAKLLAAEIASLRDVMGDLAGVSTQVRRELRTKLGSGGVAFEGSQIHRSSASRQLFDSAARIADDAGSDTLTSAHLFAALIESPSPTMTELLGPSPVRKGSPSTATPVLNEFGRDLTRMATNGELRGTNGHGAECNALLGALAAKGRKSIILISEVSADVCAVLHAAAVAISSKQSPTALKGRRIIDIGALVGPGQPSEDRRDRFRAALDEAAVSKDVILFGPEIEYAKTNELLNEWGSVLRRKLSETGLQCVCQVRRTVYEDLIKQDPAWRDLVEVIFIREAKQNEIPLEL